MPVTDTAPIALSSTRAGIRPLRREDREPLQQLLVETNVFTAEEVEIALELIDICVERPDQKDYIIYTYNEDEKVVGYYCVGPTPATESTFDLYWIAVKPSMHGRGIGGVLNAHAENLIRQRGGRLVIAETSSQPRYDKTRKFYLSHGYTELSRIRDYYKAGDDLVVFGQYLT
jgi:ribosomal protein S18 acetylase RimI-like enzyme